MSDAPTFPVRIEFPLHWGEMDALGHVNNTRYFAWFESARIRTFERIGVLADKPSSIGPILATTRCDFREAIRYPATVSVGCRVSEIGRTSMHMDYEVRVAGSERVFATGSSVIVLIDYATGEKVPVPPEIRAKIAGLGAEEK